MGNYWANASAEEREFLERYDPSKFPITVVTVDVAVFTRINGDTHVLLIKRGNYPYKGFAALPGGFIDPSERTQDAAVRELREEAGVVVHRMGFSHVADKPDRDPRGRAISHVFWAEAVPNKPYAGDDAVEAFWEPVHSAMGRTLAFDHNEVLSRAYDLWQAATRARDPYAGRTRTW